MLFRPIPSYLNKIQIIVSSMQTKDKKLKKKKNLKTSCTEKFLNGAVQIFEDAIKIMDLKNNYKYRLCGF